MIVKIFRFSADEKEVGMRDIKGKEISFERLTASKLYKVNIMAIAGEYESLPLTTTAYTSPKPPHSLIFVNADLFSISISWSPPPMLGPGENVIEYNVRYSLMDNNGSSAIVGSKKIQSALNKTNINITSLVQGEVYQFNVKVYTK